MSQLPVYVISDVHLGAVPAETEKTFRRFVQELRGAASQLLINGDLFDFWFEYRSVILAKHYRILSALKDLSESGTKIQFVGGNHDAWGGSFLRDEIGLELLPDAGEIDLAGRHSLVVHGDGVGEGDLGYRVLKKVIRHPLSVRAFGLLHPDFGDRLAKVVSTTEGKHGNAEGVNAERAAALASWAERTLLEKPHLDMVLAGHTHTPTVAEVQPGRYYINTGDWINHQTYLVLERDTPPQLQSWK